MGCLFVGQVDNRYNEATIQNLSFRYGRNDILLNCAVKNLVTG
jgi:hypothetical protein